MPQRQGPGTGSTLLVGHTLSPNSLPDICYAPFGLEIGSLTATLRRERQGQPTGARILLGKGCPGLLGSAVRWSDKRVTTTFPRFKQ